VKSLFVAPMSLTLSEGVVGVLTLSALAGFPYGLRG
jgi:hypothetical protein